MFSKIHLKTAKKAIFEAQIHITVNYGIKCFLINNELREFFIFLFSCQLLKILKRIEKTEAVHLIQSML